VSYSTILTPRPSAVSPCGSAVLGANPFGSLDELSIPFESHSNAISDLFADFPVFGYRAKVRRHLSRVFRDGAGNIEFQRVYSLYWRRFFDNDVYLSVVGKIARIIRDECAWSSDCFLPSDSISLLTWVRIDHMEDVSLWMTIKKEFSVDINGLENWKRGMLSDLCTYVYINKKG